MFLNQTIPPPFIKGWSVIFFGGDVNLGRRVNWNFHEQPFGNLQIMSEADLRIVNLECVVAAQGRQGIDKGEGGPYYYHARPEQINLLTEANIDVALTANNHSLDYYEAALIEQNNYLDRAEILHCGTGENFDEAARPIFIKVRDIVVAFFNVDATMRPYAATADKVGTFYLPPDKPELWRKIFTGKIADAHKKADVVLVAPHWGPNNVPEPTELIKVLGKVLIDCGADGVLGCHAHILHGVETYKNRPIIYDAGNFLFDSNAGGGGAFSILLSKRGVEEIFFVPLKIGYCETFPADEASANKICAEFSTACRKLNTEPIILRRDLIKLKFEPPTRAEKILEPVELSSSRRGEIIPPMTEPLPEWTPDKVPDDAIIEPKQFGAVKLIGCRVSPECLLMKKRQMLYVETWWTLAEPTDKDLTIKILGVPAIKGSMPNFGAGMDHQACDWLWPTNRWKMGVIYYERFGLRPPNSKQLVNVDVSLQISVLDDKFTLDKYIHPTKIQLQIPNHPSPKLIDQPIVTPEIVNDVEIDKFKHAFRNRNGVIFFMLRNLKEKPSGLELSALRRATLFKNYLGCNVFLLTNEFQNNLYENFIMHKADGILLNMYDYFQGINRAVEKPRKIYVRNIPKDWKMEQGENFCRIYRQDGSLAMYLALTLANNRLSYINFFDENHKKFQRDTYDALGFLSRRQILDIDSGAPKEEFYYKPDGSVAIKANYDIVDNKSQIKSLDLVGENFTVDHPRKLMRYWLEQLTSDKTRTYFLIGDRSPEYTRFYAEVKRRELKNIFVLHQLHNLHVLENFDPMTAPTKRWYNFLTDQSFQSDAVISLTNQQRDDIVKRYGLTNAIVLPHAITKKISPASTKPEPYKIIFIGRLVDQKNPEKAIEAFKIVHDKLPQATLHFYGLGTLIDKLKAMATSMGLGDAVIFEGFVNNMAEIYSSAALCILTSRYEGSPLVVQESLQNNCPVVAFDCNYGPSDSISDGVNGYLVPVGDIQALADRIIKILTEPGLRDKLAANCSKGVEKFSPEVVARQWANLFYKLMNNQTFN